MSEGYTLKEMVEEMRELQRADSIRSIKILEHASNVDKHLDILNSKVATNVKKIGGLESEHTKIKTVMGVFSLILTGAWGVITFIFK